MPKKTILVVGELPTTPQIGQEVLTARGYDEAIEMPEENFDVIIIPAVYGTTNGHGFLQKIRERNDQRRAEKLPCIPILVYHSSHKLNIVVDEGIRGWNLEPSMCSFGNATFVNTSTPGWEDIVADWLVEPRRITKKAA